MVKFVAVGDIMMGGKVEEIIIKYGSEYLFEHVAPILQDSDITFGNLEAPLTNEKNKVVWDYSKILDEPVIIDGKMFGNSIFCKALPESIDGLVFAGFGIVSLANNHIMDYGKNGLFDTLNVLSNYNIKSIGAGKNLTEARKPVIIQIKNVKVGFLAYCDVYVSSKKEPGNAPSKYIERDIQNLKDSVDIIIISIHQGMDIVDYPLPNEVKLMHSIIDFGANLILRHHPHVIQGIEHYNNGTIVYSPGNFVFDYEIDPLWKDLPKTRESILFQCEISKQGISEEKIIPVILNNQYQPVPAIGEKRDEILYRINKLSLELTTNASSFCTTELENEYAKTQTNLAFHVLISSIKKKQFKNIISILSRVKIYHIKLLIKYLIKSTCRL